MNVPVHPGEKVLFVSISPSVQREVWIPGPSHTTIPQSSTASTDITERMLRTFFKRRIELILSKLICVLIKSLVSYRAFWIVFLSIKKANHLWRVDLRRMCVSRKLLQSPVSWSTQDPTPTQCILPLPFLHLSPSAISSLGLRNSPFQRDDSNELWQGYGKDQFQL